MKWLLIILLVFLLQGIYAKCLDSQININSAQLNELDKLYGIGKVKAQEIINSRHYDSIDDLINAKGIGEITLQKIKEQGLACIGESTEDEKQSENSVKTNLEETSFEEPVKNNTQETKQEKPIEIIKLNSKNIKTEIDEKIKEEPNKDNYATYLLIGFCILLGFLFILRRKKYKNEFD